MLSHNNWMVWNSKYARPLTASQIIVLLSSFRNERMKHFADARFSCACLVFCVGICLCSFCNRMHSSLGAQFICLDFQVPRKKGRQRVMSECFYVCECVCVCVRESAKTHGSAHIQFRIPVWWWRLMSLLFIYLCERVACVCTAHDEHS